MIEALQAAAAGAATGAQGVPATAVASQSPQANIHEVRQFTVAMQQAGQAPAAAAAPAAASVSTQPSGGARAVLGMLDNLNGGALDIKSISQSMTANTASLTPGEMMQMTMRCHQFLFQCSLTSNVANRTSDGVQQLFRQQS